MTIIILITIMLHFNLVPKVLSGYLSSPSERLVGRTVGRTMIDFPLKLHIHFSVSIGFPIVKLIIYPLTERFNGRSTVR